MIPYRIENTPKDTVEYLNVEPYQLPKVVSAQTSNETVQQVESHDKKMQLMNVARETQTMNDQSGGDAAMGKVGKL